MMRAVAAKRAFTDKTMTRGRKEKEGETNLFPCVGQGYRGEREREGEKEAIIDPTHPALCTVTHGFEGETP